MFSFIRIIMFFLSFLVVRPLTPPPPSSLAFSDFISTYKKNAPPPSAKKITFFPASLKTLGVEA